MTSVSIRILALATVASLPLMAQQPAPSPQPPTVSSPQATPPQQTNPEPGASQNSSPQAAVPVSSTGNSPEVANPQMRPVTGELENKLDTKDAKSGDSVAVKTTESATTAGGVEIPKGSRITGHIVDVAPKGQNGSNNARVTIQFDQAQLKNGQNLPIRSVIQSVAPAGTAQADAAGGPPATSPSSNGAGTAATGSQPSGAGNNPPAASAQAPGSNPAAQPPGTVVATKGNLAIKTTSIPGVLLIGDVNGRPFSNAAGALLGANQDVHLDGGTVMVVAIMSGPSGIPGHGQ